MNAAVLEKPVYRTHQKENANTKNMQLINETLYIIVKYVVNAVFWRTDMHSSFLVIVHLLFYDSPHRYCIQTKFDKSPNYQHDFLMYSESFPFSFA